MCTTGPLWLLLAITDSLFGTSPSWTTSLAHSLTFLSVLPFWTLSLTLSRGSSVTLLRITLVVALGPAHAQGSLWWNDACYHALVARNGSWRDFRRSGSLEDQARFRLLRQQFHSAVRSSRTHFWNEWLGAVTSLSRRAPSGPLLALLALPSLSMRRVPIGAPIFPLQLGTLLFPTTSSTLSALRLSRPCTNLADLMLPSLTTNSLLHSPSATSLHHARTAPILTLQNFIPLVASSSAFLL